THIAFRSYSTTATDTAFDIGDGSTVVLLLEGHSMTTQDPVAVVTGAGSGIGRQITNSLLDAGYRVVLVGRRQATLDEVVTAAGRTPATARVVAADVTSEAEVAETFRSTIEQWQRVDLLVNNAGTFGPSGDPDEIDTAQWQACVDVNLTGTFRCA